jgi:hypothetical protein
MVPPVPTQAPVANLLGDDDGFTPYVQAPIEEDFGQFHEAPIIPNNQVTSPTST